MYDVLPDTRRCHTFIKLKAYILVTPRKIPSKLRLAVIDMIRKEVGKGLVNTDKTSIFYNA